jgi:anti-sigma factor (TIGR02949 family)
MGSPEVGGCDDVRRHLWPYLDREADRPTCAELEAHLVECDHCRRMAEFDQRFKQLVRRCADAEPVSQTVVETLRTKVEAVIRIRRPSGA